MKTTDTHRLTVSTSSRIVTSGLWLFGGLMTLVVLILVALLALSPVGNPLSSLLRWIFALDSVQLMWYLTRSAGLTAFLILWLSVVWGLAVSSRIFDRLLHRSYSYEFHQFLSLLAIGFMALHIVVLSFDRYLPYTISQVLVPFLSPYRPVWVGVGTVAFYLVLLVTVTFYMRTRIGMKAFRTIHLLSLVSYVGVTVHGFMSGTDSSLPTVGMLYVGTFLVTVFLLAYWLITIFQKRLIDRASASTRSNNAFM